MIVEAYTQCDICGKKIVSEISDAKKETSGRNTMVLMKSEGNTEYDVCDDCTNTIKVIKNTGRNVVISTHELIS